MTKAEAWRILGLPSGSGRDAIKGRYAELAVRYHPEEEPEKFAAVYEAYKTVLEEGASQTRSRMEDVFFWEEEPGGRTDASSDGFDRPRGEDEWDSEFVRLEKQYDEEQEEKRKKEEAEKLQEERRKEQATNFMKSMILWFPAYLLSGAVSIQLFSAAEAVDSFNKSVFDGCFHSMDILFMTLFIFSVLVFLRGPFLLLSLAQRYTLSDIPAFFADRFGRKKDKKQKRSKLVWIPRFLLMGILLTAVGDILDYPDKHKCGFGLKWEIIQDGVFAVTGTGAMTDYEEQGDTPWSVVRDRIRIVILAEGVERVGNDAFSGCRNLEYVQVAGSVKEMGGRAFASCSGLRDIRFLGSAPSVVGDAAFWNVTNVSLHYPLDDPTWTGDVLTTQFWEADSNGGLVWRWVPFGPDGQDLEDEAVVYDSGKPEEPS